MIVQRPATDEDKRFLKRLFRRVYENVVIEQFGHWDDGRYSRYFNEIWLEQNYQILQKDGEPFGAVWLVDAPDHIWLREIQICPKCQNQGIGSELLLGFIDRAAEVGLPLRLRVLRASRARSLYERLGFRITGEYGDSHLWMERGPGNT